MSNANGKKVILNSIIYSFSGLLLKCFSFFLLPLYTAYLTTADYGITSIATSFISTMEFVISFSLFSAVLRFYVDLKDDPEKLKRFYGTICTFVVASGVVFFAILTLLKNYLSKYVFLGVDYYPIILVCLISLIFQCLHGVFDNILKSQQKALKSSILSILYFFVNLILNLIFVVFLKYGALGTLLATLISSLAYVVYFFASMLSSGALKLCFDFGLLKSALKYSIPIMPHNLSTSIANLISKVFIGDVASLASVGVYSIAMQFGNVADTVQGYVDKAYGPWLYEKLNYKDTTYKDSIRGVVRFLCYVLGAFLLCIALFSHDYIILFMNSTYAEAWKYVPFIVTVFVIKTMYYFYVEVLFYFKKASKFLFVATLSSSVLNIVLSYFFISEYGVYGSIIADGISMMVRVGIVYIISKRFENIGLYLKDFIIYIFVVTAFIFTGLLLSYTKYSFEFSIINLLYKIFVVLLYIILALAINRKQVLPAINILKSKIKNRGNL